MKFVIVGAGALGLLFGGKLLEAGHEVTFWTRSSQQAELLDIEGRTYSWHVCSAFLVFSHSLLALWPLLVT